MDNRDRVEVLMKSTTMLLRMGFQAQQLGYRYLRESVWVVYADEEQLNGGITKFLYPEIAKLFGTTDKQVERAIRNSIETAWNKGNREAWKKLSESFGEEGRKRPTNTEMIRILVEAVKKES